MKDIPGGIGSASIGRTVGVNPDALFAGFGPGMPAGPEVSRVSRETLSRGDGTGQTRKYNNQIVVGEYTFQSKKEARRYNTLATLAYAGRVRDLRVHPPFDLLGRDGTVVYQWTADFAYLSSEGVLVVEDCKSAATRKKDTWRVVKKLFRATYGFDITEV